jgi:hypothetical protein
MQIHSAFDDLLKEAFYILLNPQCYCERIQNEILATFDLRKVYWFTYVT